MSHQDRQFFHFYFSWLVWMKATLRVFLPAHYKKTFWKTERFSNFNHTSESLGSTEMNFQVDFCPSLKIFSILIFEFLFVWATLGFKMTVQSEIRAQWRGTGARCHQTNNPWVTDSHHGVTWEGAQMKDPKRRALSPWAAKWWPDGNWSRGFKHELFTNSYKHGYKFS